MDIKRHLALLLPAFLLPLGTPAFAFVPLPSGDPDHDESNAYLFAQGGLSLIEVTLDPDDFRSLLDDPWQDDYRRCTVRFANALVDETVHDVGIRVRGNTSRGAIKKSWKLSFNKFVPGRRFHGLEKMNLNGDRDDPSVIRSRLALDLYRATGVPAPRAVHVRLRINDGSEVEGVFIHVEQVDEEFTEAWFGNKNGNLYKCLYRNERADLRYLPPGTPETYEAHGGGEVYAEKNHDDPDYSDLAEFLEFVDTATDEEFAAGLGDRLRLDSFLRAMAVDVATGNWDDYWFGANNYYLYHNEGTDRFEFIPHDLDNTFGIDYFGIDWSTRRVDAFGEGGFGSSASGLPPLILRVMNEPVFRDQIHRYALDLARGPFRIELQGQKIDRVYGTILPYVYEGSYRSGRMDRGYTKDTFVRSYPWPGEYIGSRDAWDYGLKPFIENRAASIEFRITRSLRIPKLRINEVVADNRTGDRDGAGEREDWIELHNYGPARIDLGGKHLSDDPGNPMLWEIPEGNVIEAYGYHRIWCDGETDEGPDHAPFRLDVDGEGIVLTDDAGNRNIVIDGFEYRALAPDVSAGRLGDEEYPVRFFQAVTPLAANVYGGNLAPRFRSIEREPAVPEGEEPHGFHVSLVDLDGSVEDVRLFVDAGEGVAEYGMADGGTGGDRAPGDGIWYAGIPGFPKGAAVRYWIAATDDSGAAAHDPPGAPGEAWRYIVHYEPPPLFLNELYAGGGNGGDWVEIHNGGGAPLDLEGFALSDDPDRPDAFLFPALRLEPGGFLLVRCDGLSGGGELHAPFKLSAGGEWVGLFAGLDAGRVPVDSVSYPGLADDESYARSTDGTGTWSATRRMTPGSANVFLPGEVPPASLLTVGPTPVRGGRSAVLFFRLDKIDRVRLRVYDAAGREVRSIMNAVLGPGDRRVEWDLRDRSGREVSPGIYFVKLETTVKNESARVVVVR